MVARSWYAAPAWGAQVVARPPQIVPPQPSPAFLAQQAESVLPGLTVAQLALVYAVAFCMLVPSATDHVFRPEPRDIADVALLTRAHVVTPQQGGYVLDDLGHAIIEVVERRHIEQRLQPAGR
jgi:hypothetical protein